MNIFGRLRPLTYISASFLLVILFIVPNRLCAHGAPGVSAEQALLRLKAGNARFVSGKRHAADYTAERKQWSKSQQPYAIVLACADSRVSPEIIFDESLGRLFVIRNAGNIVDSVALGSIEYAVEHLGAKLLLILGHESCGAVKASMDGGEPPSNVAAIVRRIAPALRPNETVEQAVEANIRLQMSRSQSQSKIIRDMVAQQSLTITGAVYHFGNGKVEWLAP